MKKSLLARLRSGGFTMIELLIVIAILGILAVMVLAAINPLEQINRGRDTAKRGDAEQLLGAFERYNAFNGYFPWQENEADNLSTDIALDMGVGSGMVNTGWVANNLSPACPVLSRLSASTIAGCVGTNELKESYVTRVDDAGGGASATTVQPRALYVWYTGDPGDNAYVCFSPQSDAFKNEATDRCNSTTPLPDDLIGASADICPASGNANAAGEVDVPMICLP